MSAGKMHPDEVDTDVSLVRRLLAAQFPQWADLPIAPVPSAGTDNAIYRLGDDMAVRLPRIHGATAQVEKEQEWLPRLAPYLPLTIPAPLAKGMPGEGYPWQWSVYRWLDGEHAAIARVADPAQPAKDLTQFLVALQGINPAGGPPSRRGVPLSMRDAETRAAIASLAGMRDLGLDISAVVASWDAALQVPNWDNSPVWIHGDLLPLNLLVRDGRLSAIIDWGGLGVGDPACDLIVAWTLFSAEARELFHALLAVDAATWARGRGWALSWGVIALPYYRYSNPALAAVARCAIDETLADRRHIA